MPGGGARRKPAQRVESTSLQEVLSAYLATDPLPFQFDAYNHLQPQQAASGQALLASFNFLHRWLRSFPDAQLVQKQFVSVLSTLVQTGALGRYPPGHRVWENIPVLLDAKQREWWAAKQGAKVTVMFYHLRRLKSNNEKLRQAKRLLDEKGRAELSALLAMVVVPKKSPKKRKIKKPSGLLLSISALGFESKIERATRKQVHKHRHIYMYIPTNMHTCIPVIINSYAFSNQYTHNS